jgi:G:T-mismatch repair DNA endonuclease (very short patch repair protein)
MESDPVSYCSAATARDRDKVRADILQGLGWKLLRVWSTEWRFNRERAADALHSEIEQELERDRTKRRTAQVCAAGSVLHEETVSGTIEPTKDL